MWTASSSLKRRQTSKLCDAFQSGKCRNESCKELHICRFFLQGSCKFGEKCTKGHSFSSTQTINLLAQHKLHGLPTEALQGLFKKVLKEKIFRHASQSSELPEPCSFYNKGGGCKNGDRCQFLHVCDHYITGNCSFGDRCKQVHHFDTAHSNGILAKYGLGHLRDNAQILLKLRISGKGNLVFGGSPDSDNGDGLANFLLSLSSGGKPKPTSPPASISSPTDDKLEICGFNLRGMCSYGEKCNARHTSLPYQWEYSSPGQMLWSTFADKENKDVEEEFCDCDVDLASVTTNEKLLCLIDFETLTGKLRQRGQGPESGVSTQIRRLSTMSSVLAAEGHVYRTKWQWYWQDENDIWQMYDDSKTNTSSEKIEQDYLSDLVEKKHTFTHGSNKYNIHMNDPNHLYQQNEKYKTKRDVRRRPARFVDKEVMKRMMEEFKLKRQRSSRSSESEVTSVPDHWAPLDPDTDPAEEFQLVRISEKKHYDEYSRVKKQFIETMKGHVIKSINRVQNIGLWEDYERQKSKISKKNSGTVPEERWLFHGTNRDTVHPICQQGFDWRLSGKHGTRYGKGSYFATEATYSHKYVTRPNVSTFLLNAATPSTGTSTVFMAKVIVGSYVVGGYETTRPPAKDALDRLSPLHDSCVNDVKKPSIFVIFERSQAYPYYIIKYQ